jgi:hypothetical protein
VIQVLAAFVRLQSQQPTGGPDRIGEDVQAALDALAPLLQRSSLAVDLRGADLTNAQLLAIPENRVLVDDLTELSNSTGFGPPTVNRR